MEELLAGQGQLPDALVTTSYVLLEGVFDVLQALAQRLAGEGLRVATFGDTQLLDFVPLKVNAIYQQHALIAERALELALAAIEENGYPPGLHADPAATSSCASEPAAMRLVDTHNHLDFPDFDADRAAVLQRSRARGVERQVVLGVYRENWQRVWALVDRPRRTSTRPWACTRSTWRGTTRNTSLRCASGCNACAATRSSARWARSAWTTTWKNSTARASRPSSRSSCALPSTSSCRCWCTCVAPMRR